MLKVLIVDDDAFSRTDIKNMIEWEKNGFVIIGEASNGINAVQIIESDVPDIVITDMYMPSMNGVELIGYTEQNYPQIRVIALSAYDDFDYVRQSMKKGAIDYVLKHRLNSSILIDILETARNSIMKYRNEREERHFISEQLSSGKVILSQEFIYKMITGSIVDTHEIMRSIQSLEINIEMENLVVAVAEIDDFKFVEEKFSASEIDAILKTFLEISRGILKEWEKSIIIHIEKGKFAIIFSLGAAYSMLFIYNQLFTILDRMRTGIKRYLNMTACFSVSKVCRDIREISKAYMEADMILKDKFYKGKNSIFIENTVDKSKDGFFCLDIKDEKNIIMAVRSLDYEKAKKHIDEIFNKIIDLRLGSKSTQMVCAELINIINKVSKETGLEITQMYTSEDIPYNMMQKYETAIDIKEWILSLYGKLISMLDSIKMDNEYSDVTKKVVEFINRNYKKDISLSDAAAFTGMSNSYISRVFKEDSGRGFIEYLNHVRVENAKHLIENGEARLKEIVEKVGFNNYNYFFKVFKEIVGMTPLEYEQLCKK